MSTLRVAMNAATSSLLTTQARMSVTASNIANADTEGYSRKTSVVAGTSTSGWGSGVSMTGVASTADANLLRSLNEAEGALGKAQSVSDYRQAIADLMGNLSSDGTGDSLSNQISTLVDALSSLEDTPESSTLAAQVVAAADDLASTLRETSSEVQSLRAQADSDIADAVDTVNSKLEEIEDLNDQIIRLKAAGEPTGDIEDQRAEALSAISALMDVSYFTSSTGEMKIYTTGGTILLDGTARTLEFSESGSVSSSATYPGTLSGITVAGKDITSDISSGAIDGLLAARDTELPAVQDELDTLANTLISSLNAVSNDGTAIPAPNSLTGTVSGLSGTALSATGSLRIAVTDSDGTVISTTDLDLTAYATTDDLVSAIDALGGVSASFDSDGKLVISADNSDYGIALNPLDSAVTSSSGESITSLFGLNDMMTGTGASDIQVTAAIRDNPSLLAVATLSDSATLAAGDIGIASGDGSIAGRLLDALSDNQSFVASGTLGSKTCSLADYASSIVSEAASRNELATTALSSAETRQSTLSDTIASVSGVNVDEETAEMETLQNAYAAAAKLLEALNSMFDDLLNAVQS